jgi:branched-subunit amino acid transport protein
MSFWLVMVVCGLVTFATRLAFIAVEGRVSVPAWFRAMLPFVPVATLSALIAPDLARPNGAWDLGAGNSRLLAAVAAVVVAAVTRRVLLTIVSGFAVLALLEWLR